MRRRTSKIARLPWAMREEVNVMLRDGMMYKEIIRRIGEAGVKISKDNLITWRKTGHED